MNGRESNSLYDEMLREAALEYYDATHTDEAEQLAGLEAYSDQGAEVVFDNDNDEYLDESDLEEAAPNYELELLKLQSDVNVAIFNQSYAFDALGDDYSASVAQMNEFEAPYLAPLLEFQKKIIHPTERLEQLTREFDAIVINLNMEWDEIPDRLETFLREWRVREILSMPPKEFKSEELEKMALDMTVEKIERETSRALDAANPAKLASKEHHAEKKKAITEHREKYPEESLMYVKQRFFKAKDAGKSQSKFGLVKEELDAWQLAEKDSWEDRHTEEHDAWEDDVTSRMAILEEAKVKLEEEEKFELMFKM